MTIRTHDHDSTDRKATLASLLVKAGLTLALLVATATAGIGSAAALPGEAEPSTVTGLSTPASSGSQINDSNAAPGSVIQAEVVGMNEKYIAVEVQFPQDIFAGEEQFPQDIFDGEEQFPQDIFDGEEEIPVEAEVIPPRGSNNADADQRVPVGMPPWGPYNANADHRVSNSDDPTVSDLAYLAPAGEIEPADDGEMPIFTLVAMDFENPHEVTMYFRIEDGWPREYLMSDSADERLELHVMALGGWHLLPRSQPAIDAPSVNQEPDGTGPVLMDRPTFDSRPETGTDAIVGDPSTINSSGAMPIPQGDIPVPGGMP